MVKVKEKHRSPKRDKGESESESVFTSLFSERSLKVSLNKKVKSEGWNFS